MILTPACLIQSDLTFIGTVIENIEGLHSSRAFLFVSEDQVDPVVYIFWHVLGLEGFPVFMDEVLRRFGPAGEDHMIDALLTGL